MSPRTMCPFIFWHFLFSILTCVILSTFSCFKFSRWGFSLCFWAKFGLFAFFKLFFVCFCIQCRNNQPCAGGFFQFLLIKKLEYLLEIKVSDRLLLVLGVMSPRTKCPFFWHFLFSILTCVILSTFSCFKFSRWGFSLCFWAKFGLFAFFKLFLFVFAYNAGITSHVQEVFFNFY